MTGKKYDMKNHMFGISLPIVFSVLFLVAAGMGLPAHGQVLEFGYQLHPEKPLENTEAILQVYVMSGESMMPKEITDLKATSTDSKVVQILGIERADQYTTNIRIKTLNEGTANIVVAASGFSSKEIPITVYTNNNNPTKILLKATPDDFAVDSPKFGYLTVELLTSGGLPTKATNDTKITLISPNSGVITLVNNELTIPQGKYYAIGQFKVKDTGDAIIFAETQGMKKVSSKIHIRKALEPLTLKLYVYPQNYLSLTNNMGYAIVQLEDASGFPVKATRDIKIGITVDSPGATVNTSSYSNEVIFDKKEILIKEGTYSAYTTFTPRPSFADLVDSGTASGTSISYPITKSYNFGISAQGYSATGNTITVTHSGSGVGELNGKGPAQIGLVPFLTTGGREIVGVAYLETTITAVVKQSDGSQSKESITVPVMPLEKFTMKTTSSDLKSVSIVDPVFEKGKNAALIFGDTGTIIPTGSSEFTYQDNEGIKSSTVTPKGHLKDNLSIIAHSLIDEVLVGEEFPIIAYMQAAIESDTGGTSTESTDEEEEDGREGPTRFVSDAVLVFGADDIVEVEPQSVKQNQPYLVFDAKAKKVGTTTLSGSVGDFDASMTVTSKTSDPTEIQITHMGTALSGTESLATIQLLDSAQNPVFVKEDTEIKLVADGDAVVEIPGSVIIKKGDYFASFNVKAIGDGDAEISALAENFPLHKFQIKVSSLQPTLSLAAPDLVFQNNDFNGELSMSFGTLNIPLNNYNVNWNVQGAEVKRSDSVFDESGKARILLLASNPGSVSITATVTGTGLSSGVATKQITVNQTAQPLMVDAIPKDTGILGISVGGIDVVFLIIPAAAGGAIFFLKRTGRLGGVLEKFEGIKDKITSIRDR